MGFAGQHQPAYPCRVDQQDPRYQQKNTGQGGIQIIIEKELRGMSGLGGGHLTGGEPG